MRRADVLAVAVRSVMGIALLVTLAAVARSAYATVPVVVDGSRVTVPRGTEVRDLVREYSAARPGDLLSAGDRRVLARGGGRPIQALVNGGAARTSAIVRSGDVVRTRSGADIVERVVVETRTIDAAPRVIGEGPLTSIVKAGDPGLELRTRGEISGDVITSETVREAQPCVVRRTPLPGARVVALTFDDGPWPGQTARVLEILGERGVPATFFMLGHRVKLTPGLARSVAEAGHAIGNHTYGHPRLDKIPTSRVQQEIAGTNGIIRSVTGVRPQWFRAPGGHLDDRVSTVLRAEGLHSALWTVDPQDWRDDATADSIAAQVLSGVRPGAVVLLHDGGGDQSATIDALPRIIDGLRAQGYQFVTLDELQIVRSVW